MNSTLLIIWVLTGIIHMVNTLIYSVRLSGVKTQRLALALSLFNIIFIFSQMAYSIQAPLFANFVERSIKEAEKTGTLSFLAVDISWEIRGILLAATVGTVIGTLLIPSFVRIFVKGIYAFEQVSSVPKLFLMMFFRPGKLKSLVKDIRLPNHEVVKGNQSLGLPKTFLLLNILITGIYTTGILSSIFAGVFIHEFRTTAANLANVINGMATVLFVTLVDPTAASITDQAIRGVRQEKEVQSMVMYLALSRIAGTILAQLLLWPAAQLIVLITRLITSLG